MDGEKTETKPKPISPINGQPVPNGRPKGVPNKATMEFKEALNNLFNYAAPDMVDWLKDIKDPEARFNVLAKFANYIYPQLARTEVTGKNGGPIEQRTIDMSDDEILKRYVERQKNG